MIPFTFLKGQAGCCCDRDLKRGRLGVEGPAREPWQPSPGYHMQDWSEGCKKQGTFNFCFPISITLHRHLVSSLSFPSMKPWSDDFCPHLAGSGLAAVLAHQQQYVTYSKQNKWLRRQTDGVTPTPPQQNQHQGFCSPNPYPILPPPFLVFLLVL